MRTHKDLEVWQLSIDLVAEIYKTTNSFPDSEKFGLTNQIRRAAVSIPSNIAEGASRQHLKEYIQFLYISFGSINELETQFLIAKRLDYINEETYNSISEYILKISKMLSGLIKYQKSKT